MARPRTFDEERALEAAMRAFWAVGYEATTTEDLCAATGLGRSSVYNTFRSKRELFEKALAHYMEVRTAAVLDLLGSDLPTREKIRALLWQTVDADPDDPDGCLVVNTMVEVAPRDPKIAECLRRDHDRRLEALRRAFLAGQRAGEIDGDRNPDDLACFVIATITGMRVLVRGGADRAAVEAVANTALRAF
ncbi:transcriptional regulator, TetR family [Streptoalloteichus tenebrarius]|uniref:Transcriptional regulator, TetR family n=1 Tax=Streptoalloteichus tenebrarius (strain ATCC 17920 / DSM 40477 / JCM 4838 / CBS 697.72 / NBRC 16177 / NCIMB 11028 / NRRL B-12390 / A12253. 1 / ISP 5477) TaxID=1933 RepID=A0ABT1HQ12_STRSD|nr:TetR/AcrR family transcriptional regulator [Streptoalloteichus tenebrarius]MCP2257594.1 transcriptional regulator, TetR family [Streptoalloteichus tenebrarius]BFE98550.1 TetR/AcrR family transcriptional regulator [Streptoalloteichus tenebrarius]